MNLLSGAFKGSQIRKTSVKNGMISRTHLSSINKAGKATIAFGFTAALVQLLDGKVRIGTTNEGMHAECMSSTGKNKYVVRDCAFDSTISYSIFDEKGKNITEREKDFATNGYIHWSLFTVFISKMLLICQQEMEPLVTALKKEFEETGMLSSSKELFILNDFLYHSASHFPEDLNKINKVISLNTDIEITEDITSLVFSKECDMEYEYASFNGTANQKNKKTSSKKEKKLTTGEYKFSWKNPLDKNEEKLIPSYDLTKFSVPEEIFQLLDVIKGEHETEYPVNNIIMYGEAGAGKTTSVKLMSQLLGIPYRHINLSLNSEESDLIGSYVPKADGTFEFREASFAQTFRKGGIIELMEINYARPGALGVLNSALDDTGQITLGNGEIVNRHPNCLIVATTNVDYAGCQKMNASLKDRFHRMVNVKKMATKELLNVVKIQSGLDNETLILKMIDAVNKIDIKLKEEQYSDGVCSTRQLINWAKDFKYTANVILSAKNTILPGITLDKEYQDEIIDTILSPMF